jgi:pectate lyase
MKKSIIFSFLLLSIMQGFSQDYYMATPQGFGANTTGGGTTAPVTVSTYAALKSNITSAGAKVILVSGVITIPSGQPISAVVTNKSIIGLPGAKLINENQSNPGAGILYLKPGSSNVIIRNLVFIGPGAYDIDGQDNLTADGCTNLWVDHCEFQDGQDGNFDNKGLTDNVTVSWCKFNYLKPAVGGGSGGSSDHRFSNLIGSSASNAPADGHYSITFQNCYWANGCKDRMPRARNAELHILSCYYNTSVSSSKAIGLGGGTNNSTCYVQNSNFAAVSSVYSFASGDGGTAAINYNNCLNLRGAINIGTVAAPSYTATLIPVDQVANYVANSTCGAGATLQVTSAGVISSGTCTNLSTDKNTADNGINFYPTVVDDILKIHFSEKATGKSMIEVYAVNGQKVINLSKNITSDETVEVHVDSIKAGSYVCKVSVSGKTANWKFIKN